MKRRDTFKLLGATAAGAMSFSAFGPAVAATEPDDGDRRQDRRHSVVQRW